MSHPMRGTILILSGLLLAAATHAAPFNVRDYGAVGDGVAKDTAAVQKAIDACADAGGGTVTFPPGVYKCGSLHLRNRLTLTIESGATILGSRDGEDYDKPETLDFKNDSDIETSFFHHALIWGEDVEHLRIEGGGTIDCNFMKRMGPKAIALKRCVFIAIAGVRIVNIPNYTISMIGCENVDIDGVTILNGFADGIDPDSCRNVRIANCRIETVDDAIVPKASFSLGERRPCENITVTNCVLSTVCNGFKLGTESGGDFRRITVSNCVITGYNDNRPCISGLAIESVDGSNIDGVTISNIAMVDARAPIFIRLGNRGRDMETSTPGSLRNVCISNVTASRASHPCVIAGIPGHPVQGVTLTNIRADFSGGNPVLAPDATVPELEDRYPEALMFGPLPAYGLYCRHAEDLTLQNIAFRWQDGFWRVTTDIYRDIRWPKDGSMPTLAQPAEAGIAAWFDDTAALTIDNLNARPTPNTPLLHFNNIRNALVRGCMPAPETTLFLEIAGADTQNIALTGNNIPSNVTPTYLQENVPPTALTMN